VRWRVVSEGCSDPEELILGTFNLLIIPAKVPKDYFWLAPFPNYSERVETLVQCTVLQERPALAD